MTRVPPAAAAAVVAISQKVGNLKDLILNSI